MQTSLLIRLIEDYQEVAGIILCLLPLRSITALYGACRDVRAALKQQPEHPWLACAHSLPPDHPLLVATCVRAALDEQHRVHSSFALESFSGSVSVPDGRVSFCSHIHPVQHAR